MGDVKAPLARLGNQGAEGAELVDFRQVSTVAGV